MISAGQVGATFEISDLVSPVLTRIAEGFERLDAVIKQTKEALATITLPPGLTAGLERIDTVLGSIGGAADKSALGVSGAFGKMDASISATQANLGALKAEMAGLALPPVIPAPGRVGAAREAALPTLIPMPGGGGGQVPPRAPHGAGGGPGFHPHAHVPLPGDVGSVSVGGSGGGWWEAITGLIVGVGVEKTLKAGGELELQKQLLRGMGGISEGLPGDWGCGRRSGSFASDL